MGLDQDSGFSKYHRVLNRAKFNSVSLSKILLGLLISLLPDDSPIVIVIDETIEQRRGKKIKAKGVYRDAVRSTAANIVTCWGLSWQTMTIIVPVPFCQRPWALPFMTVLMPSKHANESSGKKHRTSNNWAVSMMTVVSQWLGRDRQWILLTDGAYACFELATACIEKGATQISRLRMDAQLYQLPAEPVPGKRGRKRIKGDRIKLKHYVGDDSQEWHDSEVAWYGEKPRAVKLLSQTCLWYPAGKKCVKLRYVLVVDPTGEKAPEAFYSTDINLTPELIVEHYVRRWNIEVTIEESRSHLGFGTQRQWADLSIARTTPLLLGIYSVVTIFAIKLRMTRGLTPGSTAWYDKKGNATFSDVLSLVRQSIWADSYFPRSCKPADILEIKHSDLQILINQLAAA